MGNEASAEGSEEGNDLKPPQMVLYLEALLPGLPGATVDVKRAAGSRRSLTGATPASPVSPARVEPEAEEALDDEPRGGNGPPAAAPAGCPQLGHGQGGGSHMQVFASVLLDGVEAPGGRVIGFPSGPVVIEPADIKAQLQIRLFGGPVPTWFAQGFGNADDIVQECGTGIELSLPVLELAQYGAPLYTSLWLGLPAAGEPCGSLMQALHRAKQAEAPKVRLTLFRSNLRASLGPVSRLVEGNASAAAAVMKAADAPPLLKADEEQVRGVVRCLDESSGLVGEMHSWIRRCLQQLGEDGQGVSQSKRWPAAEREVQHEEELLWVRNCHAKEVAMLSAELARVQGQLRAKESLATALALEMGGKCADTAQPGYAVGAPHAVDRSIEVALHEEHCVQLRELRDECAAQAFWERRACEEASAAMGAEVKRLRWRLQEEQATVARLRQPQTARAAPEEAEQPPPKATALQVLRPYSVARVLCCGNGPMAGRLLLAGDRDAEAFRKALLASIADEGHSCKVHLCGPAPRALSNLATELGQQDVVLLLTFAAADCLPHAVFAEIRRLHAICHSHRSRTVVLWLPPQGALSPEQAEFAELLTSWARSSSDPVVLADGGELLLGEAAVTNGKPLWEPSGFRPSTAGLQLLGRRLAPVVAPLLSRAPAVTDGKPKEARTSEPDGMWQQKFKEAERRRAEEASRWHQQIVDAHMQLQAAREEAQRQQQLLIEFQTKGTAQAEAASEAAWGKRVLALDAGLTNMKEELKEAQEANEREMATLHTDHARELGRALTKCADYLAERDAEIQHGARLKEELETHLAAGNQPGQSGNDSELQRMQEAAQANESAALAEVRADCESVLVQLCKLHTEQLERHEAKFEVAQASLAQRDEELRLVHGEREQLLQELSASRQQPPQNEVPGDCERAVLEICEQHDQEFQRREAEFEAALAHHDKELRAALAAAEGQKPVEAAQPPNQSPPVRPPDREWIHRPSTSADDPEAQLQEVVAGLCQAGSRSPAHHLEALAQRAAEMELAWREAERLREEAANEWRAELAAARGSDVAQPLARDGQALEASLEGEDPRQEQQHEPRHVLEARRLRQRLGETEAYLLVTREELDCERERALQEQADSEQFLYDLHEAHANELSLTAAQCVEAMAAAAARDVGEVGDGEMQRCLNALLYGETPPEPAPARVGTFQGCMPTKANDALAASAAKSMVGAEAQGTSLGLLAERAGLRIRRLLG